MSGLCKDCKWWDSGKVGYEIDGWDDVGECGLTTHPGFLEMDHPESKAVGLGTGYSSMASLLTAPDFGCVQWTQVEESV